MTVMETQSSAQPKSSTTDTSMTTNPLTIEQLVMAYRSGRLTAREFLSQKLAQIRQDATNAWLSVLSDTDLDVYLEQLDNRDPNSLPLYGVPFAIKDNIDLAQLPTTAGCKAFAYQPKESAFIVQTLIEAGAVPLGKTNLDQFATGLVGTRSPWGATKNSFIPEYISGGSSSGSAVSVAIDQVFFSLGTDTAGSGRVPAAFNNLYGLKATKGLVSCRGVVPACRSLDCVTLFAKSAQDISLLYSIAATYDEKDDFARPIKPISATTQQAFTSFKGVRIGVPALEQLAFFGNDEYQALFEQTTARLTMLGAELVEFDLQPFIEAASLLYQGPWVAERYAAIEDFFQTQPEQCLPVIQKIIGGAKGLTAVETFKAMYALQAYKVRCDKALQAVDAVLTPTTGTIYTIDEVNADPIQRNSDLGYYTNFMNLLDYCAIAVPAGFTNNGLPFGVTFFSSAFSDDVLLNLAQCWQQENSFPLGATGQYSSINTSVDLLVCGAHMQGLPLNYQLLELGGSLKAKTKTAAHYQLVQLAGGPPMRPGLIRNSTQGQKIEVEIWRIPQHQLGSLLAQIPHPLGLGKVELENQHWVTGFICEPIGLEGAKDVSQFNGWRRFLAQS